MDSKVKINKSKTKSDMILFGTFLITVYFKTNSADPFNTPKLYVLAILCGILVGPLVYSFHVKRITKRNVEGLAVSLSTLFIIGLTWALFNTDVFIRGFIGDTQRRNGYLHYFFLMILFLYLVRFANFEMAEKFMKIILWTSLLVGIYGTSQILGKDFVDWNNPYNSMIATMGNPNFSSAILACFVSVSAISIFALYLSAPLKTLAGVGSLISLYAIIGSDSRQGLVIISITISLFLCIKALTINLKIGIPATLLNLLLIILGVLGMLKVGPLQNVLYKESISVRGYYWRAGIEMFKDNILTGVGLDSYLTNFFKYRERGYPATYGFDITSSNAHNVIIQLFATGGILVGIFYLFLLLFVFLCGVRLINRVENNRKNLCIILFAAWMGLQSQAIISIDFIGLSVWSWIFAGLIVGLLHKVNSYQKIDVACKTGKKFKSETYYIPRIISLLFLIPIMIITILLNRAEEQVFFSPALKNSGKANLVFANAKKVLQNPLADPVYKFKVSLDLMDSGYYEEGIKNIELLSKQDPKQIDYLKVRERAKIASGDLVSAAQLRESIAVLDPWNAVNYFELGLIYKQLGDIEGMNRIRDLLLTVGTSEDYANKGMVEFK